MKSPAFWRRFAVCAWLLGLLVWALAETIAVVYGANEGLLSMVVWRLSANFPLAPFLIGFFMGLLGGHFFWQTSDFYRRLRGKKA